jgi:polyphosphate kinase
MLFAFLARKKMPAEEDKLPFKHLLVAQFNLQEKFLEMIGREIGHAQVGLPASIIIKMNNLEEEVLIRKLYEASCAGVKIQLIIRGICRLVPGLADLSEHITITRIVDRYLEHGRIFIFHNNGNEEIYLGSADWMNRNIYRRIEVCFPVYNLSMKRQLLHIINLQLQDNTQAVRLDENLNNIQVDPAGTPVRSQQAIYHYLQNNRQLV